MGDWLSTVGSALADEFSDISDAGQAARVLLRLGMAALLGGVLGLERERRDAPAGLRTHMMVALGTALFVLTPALDGDAEAVSRIVQGVASGIGFLGAGAILKYGQSGHIRGLTTAASIWATAAIGVAAGLGHELTAMFATALAYVILRLLTHLERRARPRPPAAPAEPPDPLE